MNIGEVTETSVNEMGTDGSDHPDGDHLSTQDYLELLLSKNKIPRTELKAGVL